MEQYFKEQVITRCDSSRNEGLLKSWKSVYPSAVDDVLDNSGGFECYICLDSVLDPVVTMCGHLYCWPCIYKWIHYQTSSSENGENQQPQCPVCKVEVSEKTLIPLYGRGHGVTAKPSSDGKAQNLGMIIPQRPRSPRCTGTAPPPIATTANTTHLRHHQNYQLEGGYIMPSHVSGGTRTNITHPTGGMFREMFYTRMFGNSESATLFTYPPNSYHLAGSTSPRVRRHVMEVDKSLSRLCFFLFCCMALCLLLF